MNLNNNNTSNKISGSSLETDYSQVYELSDDNNYKKSKVQQDSPNKDHKKGGDEKQYLTKMNIENDYQTN